MKQIIAIGGGGFGRAESDLKIEKYLLSQTKKTCPKICFLPQASHESEEYIVKFFETFIQLQAEPSYISLFGRVTASWKQHLLNQEVIYVGGGNTKSMLALWRAWNLDDVLLEAYHQGTILSGVSAGAICWFEQGITDSVWPLGTIEGLGLIEGSVCPHFDSEIERQSVYREQVNKQKIKPGFAMEDETFLHFIDGKLAHAMTARENKKILKIDQNHERVVEVEVC